jgi:hypothetical protein
LAARAPVRDDRPIATKRKGPEVRLRALGRRGRTGWTATLSHGKFAEAQFAALDLVDEHHQQEVLDRHVVFLGERDALEAKRRGSCQG